MKSHEICRNCRFAKKRWPNKQLQLECHRYPPVIPNGDITIVVWPHVSEDQGCGEFDWDQSLPEYTHWLTREAVI